MKAKPLNEQYEPTFNKKFLQAVFPHIASFNTFLEFYIPEIVKQLDPLYIDPLLLASDNNKHELDLFYCPVNYLKVYVRSIKIGRPVSLYTDGSDVRLFPKSCRTAHCTYSAPLYVEFVHENVAENKPTSLLKSCGSIPVMVKSKACHLDGLSPEEMVKAGEDCNEPGGYFIVNGNERVIRFVIQQRCNHPIALKKEGFKTRDLLFTEYAVSIRCARRDGTSTANILFFTEDKQCAFRALIDRQEVVVPFWTLLKALMPDIHLSLIKQKLFETAFSDGGGDVRSRRRKSSGSSNMQRISECEMMWKDMVESEALITDVDKYENRYLHELGKSYWDLVGARLKPGSRYEDAARYVVNKNILVHTNSWTAKFETLVSMYRKLLSLTFGEIRAENIDSFAYQEVLMPGQLFAAVLKDSLTNMLLKIRQAYAAELRIARLAGQNPVKVIRSTEQFELILKRVAGELSHALSYFMSTGNIKTTQLDLQQLSGWTVVADRLNIHRFMSHFRAVHRGQFFTKMRTTEVRKLLGETWGFLCPVHTPDGGPCGLLLHLAQDAVPVTEPQDGRALAAFKVYLHRRGIPVDLTGHYISPPAPVAYTATGTTTLTAADQSPTFPCVFDGEPVCRLPRSEFDSWVDEIRRLKQDKSSGIPQHLEVVAYRHGTDAFEGIFLFSIPGRIVRPVKHLKTGLLEWIGPLGQPWLDLACSEAEVRRSLLLLDKQKKLFQKLTAAKTCRGLKSTKPVAEATATGAAKTEQKAAYHLQITEFKDIVSRFQASTAAEAADDGDGSNKGKFNIHKLSAAPQFVQNMEAAPVNFTHVEINPTAMLSVTSALTPFSHHNQSPRNMYQCQMLKQTMATPFHCIPFRTDNKAYRLLTPQKPLVRTKEFRNYKFDDYPSGTNAVVAVISYTGFDMEDAMILNKASVERGFAHALVYKTKILEAAPPNVKSFESRNYVFSNRTPNGSTIVPGLGQDGLPALGTKLKRNAALYRTTTVDSLSSESSARAVGHVTTYHEDEEVYVDSVNMINPPDYSGRDLGGMMKIPNYQRASLKLRCVRNPVVGDKFASRAGQKGILSMLWPQEDLPFTASGVVPDILFNPHGFPSRMTIGMLIESMAGKAAAVHGAYQDSTAFAQLPRQEKAGIRWIDQGGFNGWTSRGNRYEDEAAAAAEGEKQPAAAAAGDSSMDYFGKALLRAGYQYYGTETLYSGIYGVEMEAQIFLGVVYYQRLRHMVSDKWQVRSTGPIDSLTRQPVKGRKRGGGVRFGEMERDALLAHGASALLQDRLVHCSDEHKTFVCPSCGSLLSPMFLNARKSGASLAGASPGGPGTGHGKNKAVAICRVCGVPCRLVSVPFVFRYVCNELAAMNVTIKLQLTECGKQLKVCPRITTTTTEVVVVSQK